MSRKAYLVLENGIVFEGEAFGALQAVTGELAFTTGMSGYIETLTDPSYYGQIILQTFPLIGNYGIIPEDFESTGIAAKGYIVKYPCRNPSNFRSAGDLDAFLKEQGVTGLCNIDTRALTKMIRESGVMNGRITLAKPVQADVEEAKSYRVKDAVAAVSGREQGMEFPQSPAALRHCGSDPQSPETSRNAKYKIALLDFGVKRGIAGALAQRGCDVQTFPHDTKAEDILKTDPAGIMLSNGPGDPAAHENGHIIETVHTLMKSRIPMFGICIGHQFMALAEGYKTRKMKFGHRGGNQPVKDMQTGRVYITAQNHGYTVVAGGSAFVNVNDGSCEGLEYGNSFSVQFHPEARSGPFDTAFLFDRFMERIRQAAAATGGIT